MFLLIFMVNENERKAMADRNLKKAHSKISINVYQLKKIQGVWFEVNGLQHANTPALRHTGENHITFL